MFFVDGISKSGAACPTFASAMSLKISSVGLRKTLFDRAVAKSRAGRPLQILGGR
jgi:hypothetical protein